MSVNERNPVIEAVENALYDAAKRGDDSWRALASAAVTAVREYDASILAAKSLKGDE